MERYSLLRNSCSLLFFVLFLIPTVNGQENQKYTEYKGEVVDNETQIPLESVNIAVKNTNINTVTNSEGKFLLKIPSDELNNVVVFSNLGYDLKLISVTALSELDSKIFLTAKITDLSEINLSVFGNAENMVRSVFAKKEENNLNKEITMTAFYRETIKKRNRNVSLAEAVVTLYKAPYNSSKDDRVELKKARKSTDYRRLDTVAFKLQGGPFSTLYLDVMKYPEYIFTQDSIGEYIYRFKDPTTVKGNPVFVISFTQPNNKRYHYEGLLFVDTETLALTRAEYTLYIGNREEAAEIFVQKKPKDIDVFPTEANYVVDYREKEGKWYYGYANAELTFKVDQKGKLFNSTYQLSTEMAVTDWQINTSDSKLRYRDRVKPSVIMSDEVLGFSDPDFWGAYNVIEPEKSIESAINKIQRQLERKRS